MLLGELSHSCLMHPALWRADAQPASTSAGASSSGFAPLDRELAGGGWPRGSLTELLSDTHGLGELSLLAAALAQLKGSHTAWVLPGPRPNERVHEVPCPTLPYAPALHAAGLVSSQSLFVAPKTRRESWWAMEQALRGRTLGALIGWLPAGKAEGDFRSLRRLQLLASKTQALVFLLRDPAAARQASPASLRIEIGNRGGLLQLRILKRRGRPLLDPISLQLHPAHWSIPQRAEPDTAAQDLPVTVGDAKRQREVAALLGH